MRLPRCRQRRRRCLLKGCERLYRPRHWRAQYCFEACRQAARRWRGWQASQRYRATENGKQRRRAQSRRYRQRLRERQAAFVLQKPREALALVFWHDADGPLDNPKFLAFATNYGFRPQACCLRQPQTNGVIKRV